MAIADNVPVRGRVCLVIVRCGVNGEDSAGVRFRFVLVKRIRTRPHTTPIPPKPPSTPPRTALLVGDKVGPVLVTTSVVLLTVLGLMTV